MRWLITGARGQLGTDVRRALAGEHVTALAQADLDITDVAAVADAVAHFAPDIVVNAAAYTAVDAAEADEDAALRVNAGGPAAIAAALNGRTTKLIQVSTDYVFAGDGQQPYEVDDPAEPKSAYGRTKLAGEHAVRAALPDSSYVVRTAWLYGAHGHNFVETMVRLSAERPTVSVVDDQRGAPTWTEDLAAALVELAHSDAAPGVYHCTNSGDTTWFGFAQAIFEELGADPARVLPITSDVFARAAPRPAYSVLSDRAWRGAGLSPMRHWRHALHAAWGTKAWAPTLGTGL